MSFSLWSNVGNFRHVFYYRRSVHQLISTRALHSPALPTVRLEGRELLAVQAAISDFQQGVADFQENRKPAPVIIFPRQPEPAETRLFSYAASHEIQDNAYNHE